MSTMQTFPRQAAATAAAPPFADPAGGRSLHTARQLSPHRFRETSASPTVADGGSDLSAGFPMQRSDTSCASKPTAMHSPTCSREPERAADQKMGNGCRPTTKSSPRVEEGLQKILEDLFAQLRKGRHLGVGGMPFIDVGMRQSDQSVIYRIRIQL